MPCWVVPTIAAEIWGVSVDHILQLARDGNLAYRVDEGFMFVDVVYDGSGGCSNRAPNEQRPPTFTALSEAEVEALREGERDEVDVFGDADDAIAEEALATDEEESQSPDDDESTVELGDWRTARARVSATRIPPRARPRARPRAA
ncbi:MAG: hypothetical protein WBD40_03180 [Tepidisphaeraceae bacterium]